MLTRETQALMEAAVDAVIVIDHRGRMQAVNEATRGLFGFRTDELLGQNVSMLMPQPERDAHDEYLARYLRTGVAKVIGVGRKITAQRSDGTLFNAYLSVGRVPGSDPPRFVGFVRDCTSDREAMAALRRERDRASAYLELNDAILLCLDAGRRIREVNARGSELLGAPQEDLHGRDWLDFVAGEPERERARLMLDCALSNSGSRQGEFDAIVNGDPRRIAWRCIARREVDGRPAGWLCSGEDVTDRARHAQTALVAQDRLTRVARMATLGEMAAGIAHEINQPLTAITTYARACERFVNMPQPDLAELREAVREIGAEGLRAGRIITRLRQLVRNEEPAEHTPTDVNAVIEELKILLMADARIYDTRLSISLTPRLPSVVANPVQLQQLVLNLVRNAFEAVAELPPGDRAVRLSTALTVNGDLQISVDDNGPGIDAAIEDRLFDPFITTKKSGTGLGLAISRTIAHSHGGTIEARREAPAGASFHVRLPTRENAIEQG
jgi:two-component system sensor kinase FixL